MSISFQLSGSRECFSGNVSAGSRNWSQLSRALLQHSALSDGLRLEGLLGGLLVSSPLLCYETPHATHAKLQTLLTFLSSFSACFLALFSSLLSFLGRVIVPVNAQTETHSSLPIHVSIQYLCSDGSPWAVDLESLPEGCQSFWKA